MQSTQVHPVIIQGIPEWDAGLGRVRELCDLYGYHLKVMGPNEVRDLLGIPHDAMDLMARFNAEFCGDDFEFLGTLLIRLALIKYAKEMGVRYICTGLNMEDILCEALYRVCTGKRPCAVPVRKIEDTSLLLPLWLCPKRIIDGCFPKYSLENYETRVPCLSLGRNLYYSLAYYIQSQVPGIVEQLLHGFSELSIRDPVTYSFDDELGFHTEDSVPVSLKARFMRMLQNSESNRGR
jgi:tRNA(Ile)-lysidine synthase TilS/MesJ